MDRLQMDITDAILAALGRGVSRYDIAALLQSEAYQQTFIAFGGNGSTSIGPNTDDKSFWINGLPNKVELKYLPPVVDQGDLASSSSSYIGCGQRYPVDFIYYHENAFEVPSGTPVRYKGEIVGSVTESTKTENGHLVTVSLDKEIKNLHSISLSSMSSTIEDGIIKKQDLTLLEEKEV